MTMDGVIALGPGEGRSISLAQHRQRTIVVKAAEDATAGAYRIYESTVPPLGRGAPPHLHEAAEEAFYVLDGALSMKLGDRSLEARAGSFVLVPRGTVHSFDNAGTDPARYLVIWSPPQAGRYFEELFELEKAAAGAAPDPAAIIALRAKYRFVYLD